MRRTSSWSRSLGDFIHCVEKPPLGDSVQLVEEVNQRTSEQGNTDFVRSELRSSGVKPFENLVDRLEGLRTAVRRHDGRGNEGVIEYAPTLLGKGLVGQAAEGFRNVS